MKESILRLFPELSSASKLTLVATVLNEGGNCGGDPPMIQKATLDLAVNNTSSETHIINAVLLEPIDLYANFWAGKMKKAKDKYRVVLDDWHQKLMDVQLKTSETGLGDLQGDAKDASDMPATIRASGFLPTISVNEIVNDKYTIDR